MAVALRLAQRAARREGAALRHGGDGRHLDADRQQCRSVAVSPRHGLQQRLGGGVSRPDRKRTRLDSSHYFASRMPFYRGKKTNTPHTQIHCSEKRAEEQTTINT